MRNLNGLENLDLDFLYQTLVMYREDIRSNVFVRAGKRDSGPKAKNFAIATCTAIVIILARNGFELKKRTRPQRESFAEAAWSKIRNRHS